MTIPKIMEWQYLKLWNGNSQNYGMTIPRAMEWRFPEPCNYNSQNYRMTIPEPWSDNPRAVRAPLAPPSHGSQPWLCLCLWPWSFLCLPAHLGWIPNQNTSRNFPGLFSFPLWKCWAKLPWKQIITLKKWRTWNNSPFVISFPPAACVQGTRSTLEFFLFAPNLLWNFKSCCKSNSHDLGGGQMPQAFISVSAESPK